MLVAGVRVGMKQADCHRLHAAVQHVLHGAVNVDLVQRLKDLSFEIQPFTHFQSELALDQRRGLLIVEVVQSWDAVAAELQDIPKTLGGDQGGLGTFLFDDGVGGNSETVANLGHHLRGYPQLRHTDLDSV